MHARGAPKATNAERRRAAGDGHSAGLGRVSHVGLRVLRTLGIGALLAFGACGYQVTPSEGPSGQNTSASSVASNSGMPNAADSSQARVDDPSVAQPMVVPPVTSPPQSQARVESATMSGIRTAVLSSDAGVVTPAANGSGDGSIDHSPGAACASSAGTHLFADHFATCYLRQSGEPICWGGIYWTDKVPAETFLTLSVAQDGACGLRPDCSVSCFGNHPFNVAPPADAFAQVVAGPGSGGGSICGRRSDGRVECWPTLQGPFGVPAGQTFAQIVPGYASEVCGLTLSGDATCFGFGPPTPGAAGVVQTGPFHALSATDHVCALSADDSITCWGNTAYGGTMPPSGQFVSIVSGGHHSCALRADGSAACWGTLEGDDQSKLAPPAEHFSSLVTGMDHVCGLTPDRRAVCWGRGTPDEARGTLPSYGQAAAPSGDFVELAAGYWHTCGLRPDNSIACWGAGQPGDAASDANYGQSSVPPLQ